MENESPKKESIDYEQAFYNLQERLKLEISEKEKYKEALLNVCLKL